MRARFAVAAAAAAAVGSLLSGCAIHPLPEDVARVDTYHIVRQVRCESREAIRHRILSWMRRLAAANPDAPLYQELVIQYENDPDSMAGFADAFKGKGHRYAKVEQVAKLFYDAGIAYTFDLTMTENNDLSANADFLKALTVPVFSLGFTGLSKRMRQNQRTFTVTDRFSQLLAIKDRANHKYCENQIVANGDYAYPITGRIGVDEMINTFVELTLFTNLAVPKADGGANGPPTMTDKLTFTTELSASANPKIVFTPVSNIFQPVSASLTATAGRKDAHQVTVGLAVANSAGLQALRTYLFSADRGAIARTGAPVAVANGLVIGSRVTGTGSPAELLAVIAIDQAKSREVQLIPPP